LHVQVRKKIQILPHDARIQRAPIEVRGRIDQFIQTHCFIPRNDIIGVQEHQIDITESVTRQVRQKVKLSRSQRRAARDDGQVQVAAGMRGATRQRTKQIDGLDVGIPLKDAMQSGDIRLMVHETIVFSQYAVVQASSGSISSGAP
jgi:hypothetical protein